MKASAISCQWPTIEGGGRQMNRPMDNGPSPCGDRLLRIPAFLMLAAEGHIDADLADHFDHLRKCANDRSLVRPDEYVLHR